MFLSISFYFSYNYLLMIKILIVFSPIITLSSDLSILCLDLDHSHFRYVFMIFLSPNNSAKILIHPCSLTWQLILLETCILPICSCVHELRPFFLFSFATWTSPSYMHSCDSFHIPIFYWSKKKLDSFINGKFSSVVYK